MEDAEREKEGWSCLGRDRTGRERVLRACRQVQGRMVWLEDGEGRGGTW